MVFKDYYKILGLHTNKVNNEQIKVAYRILAKQYHPDKNIGNKMAEEKFKDINEAYQVLTDSTAKRKYDRVWQGYRARRINKQETAPPDSESNNKFGEFFNVFFGATKEEPKEKKRKPKLAIKGENIETEIAATLEEVFYGSSKRFALRTINGKMTTFNIKIPPGIRQGEKILLKEQGKLGKNGGKKGDLYINIKIAEHKKFKLEGSDILTDILLTPWEAALGIRAMVEGIDGNAIVYIPPGTRIG